MAAGLLVAGPETWMGWFNWKLGIPTILVTGWVAFSLIAGVRSESTLKALISSLVLGGFVAFVHFGYRFMVARGWVTEDEPPVSLDRDATIERLRRIASDPEASEEDKEKAATWLQQLRDNHGRL